MVERTRRKARKTLIYIYIYIYRRIFDCLIAGNKDRGCTTLPSKKIIQLARQRYDLMSMNNFQATCTKRIIHNSQKNILCSNRWFEVRNEFLIFLFCIIIITVTYNVLIN